MIERNSKFIFSILYISKIKTIEINSKGDYEYFFGNEKTILIIIPPFFWFL